MSDSDTKPYVVRQGDTLLRVAVARGLEPNKIWDHEKNRELKELRDPDILAPGDVLQLPPAPPPTLQLNPKTSNKFKARVPEVEVSIAFSSEAFPLANEEYKITGVGEDPIEGTLDATGTLKIAVPLFLEHFTVAFPKRNVEHEVWPGHLDPKDLQSGVCQRLTHLGYGPVAPRRGDPFVFADPEVQRAAIMGFQKAFGLEPTGFADEKTQETLKTKAGI